MTPFVAFLQSLLETGEVVLSERPRPGPAQRGPALDYLAESYRDYRLEIAGPLLDFDADRALWAAEFVWLACWFLLERTEPEAALQRELVLPTAPASAAQHLSADLVLRYLPQVYHRARAFAPDDTLTTTLAAALRQWPLSGVLSEVEDGPLTPVGFHGHPGLQLLYAERLARHEKPAWLPKGRGYELVELVLAERGRERSPLLQQPAASREEAAP
jgi:MoxR-vWA-beta-propeller ternary system domain bpX4